MARKYETGDTITIHGEVLTVHGDQLTIKTKGGKVIQVSYDEAGDPSPSTPPPIPPGPPGGGD